MEDYQEIICGLSNCTKVSDLEWSWRSFRMFENFLNLTSHINSDVSTQLESMHASNFDCRIETEGLLKGELNVNIK